MTLTRRTLVLAGMTRHWLRHSWRAPNRGRPAPMRIVVAYPPGGSTDAIMRLVQPGLQQRLGTTDRDREPVRSVRQRWNRRGGEIAARWQYLARGVRQPCRKSIRARRPLPYDSEKDLDPVLLIGTAPYVITTATAKPYKTLADVIAFAKENPGKVSYGSVGSGSVGHLAMALLSQRAGVKLHPCALSRRRSGDERCRARGHVDLLVGSTALSMPQVEAGTIRPIVQTGKERNQFIAQVPTVAESGFTGFEAYAWWGIFAPAGTPKNDHRAFR